MSSKNEIDSKEPIEEPRTFNSRFPIETKKSEKKAPTRTQLQSLTHSSSIETHIDQSIHLVVSDKFVAGSRQVEWVLSYVEGRDREVNNIPAPS